MTTSDVSRRTLLKFGGAAAGLSVLRLSGPAHAFQTPAGEVIPWLDQPAENPVPDVLVKHMLWEDVDSWLTPNEQFFAVKHFNEPALEATTWQLAVTGLVSQPMALTLDEIKSRPREEVTFTIECSGNSGLPFLTGAIGNATWAGTSLAALLEEAGVLEDGIEVVFWGADEGEQVWRDVTITEQFARSMSLEDALAPGNILAWEMNGEELPAAHGYPLRLIAPGWYGIANVKWLNRIEVRDARYQGHFMARDYVTIREEEVDGETAWTFTSVGKARLKSAPAKVTRSGDDVTILGAAWGASIASVDVRIDDGEWQAATLTEGAGEGDGYTWTFWTLPWDAPSGEHTITSRATDTDGNVQPEPDDPFLAGKTTFWESNGQITRQIQIA